MKRILTLVFVAIFSICLYAAEPKSAFFTTSDGVKLHYLESGRGPAIVFIPGWTMPARIWESQIKYFERNYHVIAVDPRSQGESEKTDFGNYNARRAQDYRELIEYLKLKNVVLVGWSLAVHEQLTYAERFNNADVRAYVLVDGFLWDKMDTELANALTKLATQIQSNRLPATAAFLKQVFKRLPSQTYLDTLAKACIKTPDNTAAVLIFNMLTVPDWRPAISKLTVPVLYTYIPENQKTSDLLKAQLPNARLERFDNAAHALFVDEPDRFNRVVEEFVRGLK